MPSLARSLFRLLRWLVATAIVIGLGLMRWGDDLLIAHDPPAGHVDAAVVLQGSISAEKARTAGAMDLLHRGIVDRVVLSVPVESYWGQAVQPVARNYLRENYGADLAARVDFCETGSEVNSTVQEAQVSVSCIREHHWQSILIVTSDYHTRRAGIIWRKAARNDPKMHIWIEGVPDPEFQHPWWRHRQSAKIWVMELVKLGWGITGR